MNWQIDIWLVDAAEQAKEDRKELNVAKMDVTSAQREAILAFKKLRNEARISFCSQKIYELVLMQGVTSRKKFKQLLRSEVRK